ncbi:hypothetical protein BDK51DRAFT_34356 [Blyttiomyces helicus]|uniref:Uncharacterized protein n=1 Tax=Blyttiomyces helicus TaxID=388810 RepID=A0A4P9WTZ6_9FUNG|nr:hypothetical protein BDK51DRAFT_34356 [Blyttiomyces helicus]|eukprot:RKO94850.1 hypothetical protein BDK51DRAFT_34356 [Blyttiomyces helicus]
MSVIKNTGGKKSVNISQDLENVINLNEQNKLMDERRSTDGIDYSEIEKEAEMLITLRKDLERQGKMDNFKMIGESLFPNFKKKFGNFFEIIRTFELSRLDEFMHIMEVMFHELKRVQKGEVTHTEMRESLFEDKLAKIKMYTTDVPINLQLNNGLQDGQLKKLTFVLKGTEESYITVECPGLPDSLTQILFTNIADYAILMWSGGSWIILETLNSRDTRLQSPLVR